MRHLARQTWKAYKAGRPLDQRHRGDRAWVMVGVLSPPFGSHLRWPRGADRSRDVGGCVRGRLGKSPGTNARAAPALGVVAKSQGAATPQSGDMLTRPPGGWGLRILRPPALPLEQPWTESERHCPGALPLGLPRRPQDGAKGGLDGPGRPQESPKLAQEGLLRAPRRPRKATKAAKMAQYSSKTAQNGPRRPNMASRRPKMGSRRPKNISRPPSRAPRGPAPQTQHLAQNLTQKSAQNPTHKLAYKSQPKPTQKLTQQNTTSDTTSGATRDATC